MSVIDVLKCNNMFNMKAVYSCIFLILMKSIPLIVGHTSDTSGENPPGPSSKGSHALD